MHPTPSDLRITLIQADTRWHDPAGNREMYGELARSARGQTDLVVLPETFTSGFTNQTLGNAEDMDGETMQWMKALAPDVGAVITGSVVVREGGRYFNRLIWMREDGSFASYDKRHLFRFAGEHERYTMGGRRLVVDLNGWRICPLVCYDLRFPVYARNRFGATVADDFDYDLLLFVANWPSPRHYAWQTLLRARAIENLSYGIGVNRVGTDGNGLHYLGGSVALDPLGQPLVECGALTQVVTTTFSAEVLRAHRQRFPFHLDADAFRVE